MAGDSEDCPTASKKKCSFRLLGLGVDENGKHHQIRRGLRTTSLQVATKLRDEYRLNIDALNTNSVKPSALTLVDAMARYFQEEKGPGVSGTTLKSIHKFLDRERDPLLYSSTLLMYAEANELHYLCDFTKDHVEGWRGQWKNLGYKTATKQWERVRQFFKYAHDAEWIAKNPVTKIKRLVKPKDEMPVTALSEEEVKAVFTACDDEFKKTFLFVLLHSGLATVDAVQPRPEKLEGQHLKTYRTKTGVDVTVKLRPFLVERLNALPLLEGGYWFWNRLGGDSDHETATGNMRRKLRPIYRA